MLLSTRVFYIFVARILCAVKMFRGLRTNISRLFSADSGMYIAIYNNDMI